MKSIIKVGLHQSRPDQWCRRSYKSCSSGLSSGCSVIQGPSTVCLDRSFLFGFVIGGCYSRITIEFMSSSITTFVFNSSPFSWASSSSFTDLNIDFASNLLSCYLINFAAWKKPFPEWLSSRSGVFPMEPFRRTLDVSNLFGAYFYTRDRWRSISSFIPSSTFSDAFYRSSAVMTSHGSSSMSDGNRCRWTTSTFLVCRSCLYTGLWSLYLSWRTCRCLSSSRFFLLVAAMTPALPNLILSSF